MLSILGLFVIAMVIMAAGIFMSAVKEHNDNINEIDKENV